MSRPFTPKNLEGATFGRLSVLAPDGMNKSGHLMWRCVCECGNPVRTTGYDLVRGHTRSCGCLGLKGGWYECIDNWGDYTEVAIHEGEPSHWMPLPAPPIEAAHGIKGDV